MAIPMASNILCICLQSKENVALHKALLFLGDVFIANKDQETATNAYIVALEGFTYMDIHQS
jgi:hypothetical protein